MNRVNLDHQAGSTLHPAVLAAMDPFLQIVHHPASLHHRGLQARAAILGARQEITRLINAASEEEVIFTASHREAVVLALTGLCATRPASRQIIYGATESTVVRQSLERLTKQGHQLLMLPVDAHGLVSLDELTAALRKPTALVCLNWVNGDLGTIQAMQSLAQVCAEKMVPLFCEAGAALGLISINLAKVPISLLSLNPSGCGGPQGIGALFIRSGISISDPDLESELGRSPLVRMEDIAAIAGTGVAARLAGEDLPLNQERTRKSQSQIWSYLSTQIADVHLLGPPIGAHRISHHLALAARGAEGEALALKLDLQGFAVATRPVCLTKSDRHSPILQAIGVEPELSMAHILLTLGPELTEEEILRFCAAYEKAVRQLRNL